jgi:hypothetical protein
MTSSSSPFIANCIDHPLDERHLIKGEPLRAFATSLIGCAAYDAAIESQQLTRHRLTDSARRSEP